MGETILHVKNDRSRDKCQLTHPLLVTPNKSHTQPSLYPAPQQQHSYMLLGLLYVQLLYLNFQPELVAQYEPK